MLVRRSGLIDIGRKIATIVRCREIAANIGKMGTVNAIAILMYDTNRVAHGVFSVRYSQSASEMRLAKANIKVRV